MTDASEAKVLEAFRKRNRMCLHVLRDETDISYTDLRPVVLALKNRGILKATMGAHSGDRIYEVVDVEHLHQVTAPPPFVIPGLTEENAKARVQMIERMKERLIVEWHPVLNVLLMDYTKGLAAIDKLRFPPDFEEFEHMVEQSNCKNTIGVGKSRPPNFWR